MDIFIRLAADPSAWAALATLVAMKVVLGLDKLVFIALLSSRIDDQRRGLARGLGLSAGALVPPGAGRLGFVGSVANVAAVGVMMAASGPLLPDSHKLKSCYR